MDQILFQAEPENIEINDEFRKALNIVENTDKHVFITGRAGSGKSTLLRHIKFNTKKNAVVLAPTGVAAINVQGQTIHSFFKFPPKFIDKRIIRKQRNRKLFKKIEMLIIDEISMVRADLMDGIDHALRVNRGYDMPFGGVQVVMFGDLFQLPPVVRGADIMQFFKERYGSPYFFNANVFSQIELNYIELEKIYRQSDSHFIGLLDRIRNKDLLNDDLAILNKRVIRKTAEIDRAITLTTTNRIASRVNDYHLERLDQQEYEYDAEVSEKFEETFFPTDASLKLRKDAQVMMIVNDPKKRWVNGTLAQIESLHEDSVRIKIGNEIYDVEKSVWSKIEYKYDKENDQIIEDTVGTFMQYPLKLAWAITIHKSQGKTFDNVIIDLGGGAFAHGQVYVALSRCSKLEGITLRRPVRADDIIFDKRIYEFRKSFVT